MKTFSYFLAFFISSSIFSQQQNTSLHKTLKGQVRSVSKKTFIIDKTSGNPVLKYNEHIVFDNLNKPVEHSFFGDDNTLDSKIIFVYKNNLLQSETVYNTSGKKDKITTYEYDEKGRVTTQKKYNNQGKLQFQTSYFYNKEGWLSASSKLIPSINYTMKEQYAYDTKGNLIELAKKTRIGTTKEVYEYNDKGQQVKKIEYNAFGELFSSITYNYNKQGDKISLKKYNNSGTLDYYEDYEYQYDSKGNWTKRTSFEKGVKTSVEERTITYY